MTEVFRDINGYKISNFGNCDCELIVNNGYYKTAATHEPLHVLIAKAFPETCGKWFDGCHVHHKDFNRQNNYAENLIVVTASEHRRLHNLGTKQDEQWLKNRIASIKGKNINHPSLSKEIICVETGVKYPSSMEIERIFGFSHTHIIDCCKGKRKTANGYHWRFL